MVYGTMFVLQFCSSRKYAEPYANTKQKTIESELHTSVTGRITLRNTVRMLSSPHAMCIG